MSDVSTTTAPKPAAKRVGRMTLAALRSDPIDEPERLLVFGDGGVGKTTFAISAPHPAYLGAEDGLAGQPREVLARVQRFPQPTTFVEVLEAIDALASGESTVETLVVDSLDWIEPLVWDHVVAEAKSHKIKSIEDFGFGKGYVAAGDAWRLFFAALQRLRAKRPMRVILLAHAAVKRFANPDGEDFDRVEIKLHARAAGLAREWVDAALYAAHELGTRETETGRTKGVLTGRRLLHSERGSGFDAKSRYPMRASFELSWPAFVAAKREPVEIRAAIEASLQTATPERAAVVREWLTVPRSFLALSKTLAALQNEAPVAPEGSES